MTQPNITVTFAGFIEDGARLVLADSITEFGPWLSGFGLTPPILATVQVRDRSDAQLRSVVLVAADYQGHRYLVSMLGDGSEWVQNLRAAGGMAFIKRGQSYSVMLTEIPPLERAPILKAWCQVATSGRQHLPVSHQDPVSVLEAIAGDYPLFRIDSASECQMQP
jgi:hypothetical protein